MSKESKVLIEKVKRAFEVVKENSGKVAEETAKFDRDLSQKIRRVQESSEEVVKHITERQNG